MSQMIQAVYEDGVLKPLEKLALGEHQQVQITVEAQIATGSEREEIGDKADWENLVEARDVPSRLFPSPRSTRNRSTCSVVSPLWCSRPTMATWRRFLTPISASPATRGGIGG